MEIPEEADLISVFESLPGGQDETENFYYDTSSFIFENKNEVMEVRLSPFL
ncbi:hypothetical protein [Cytobacillus firmus]|uniref:hypothetical protein n=1 Tax=Cytobacillus firmus TaxID=1399 RepID=UPI00216143B7|nr:hypothetical protein [Cytobacillus firmus]MCS0654924.1 hypothetical protein [Cytobacillus firmus]